VVAGRATGWPITLAPAQPVQTVTPAVTAPSRGLPLGTVTPQVTSPVAPRLFGPVVQNQNTSIGAVAVSGPAVAVNVGLANAGPVNGSQIGSNFSSVNQFSFATSGAAVAGSQVSFAGTPFGTSFIGSPFGTPFLSPFGHTTTRTHTSDLRVRILAEQTEQCFARLRTDFSTARLRVCEAFLAQHSEAVRERTHTDVFSSGHVGFVPGTVLVPLATTNSALPLATSGNAASGGSLLSPLGLGTASTFGAVQAGGSGFTTASGGVTSTPLGARLWNPVSVTSWQHDPILRTIGAHSVFRTSPRLGTTFFGSLFFGSSLFRDEPLLDLPGLEIGGSGGLFGSFWSPLGIRTTASPRLGGGLIQFGPAGASAIFGGTLFQTGPAGTQLLFGGLPFFGSFGSPFFGSPLVFSPGLVQTGPAGTQALFGGPFGGALFQTGPAGTSLIGGGPFGGGLIQSGPAGGSAMFGGPLGGVLFQTGPAGTSLLFGPSFGLPLFFV
jgi:hypothetical protein